MLMSQGKVTRLHVAYRVTEALSSIKNHLFTETCKNFLPVRSHLYNHIQGKGVSNDKQC